MLTVSGLALPVASPLQPANCCPAPGLAVSVTVVPLSYVGWSGLLATVPLPVVLTVSAYVVGGSAVNVAVMLLSAVMLTVSGLALPVASPLQPVKVKPALAVAVSITLVPLL